MRLHYLVNIKLTAFSFIGWPKAMVGLKIHPQASSFQCAIVKANLVPLAIGFSCQPWVDN